MRVNILYSRLLTKYNYETISSEIRTLQIQYHPNYSNLLDYLSRMLEAHTEELEDEIYQRTQSVEAERQKLDLLLYRMMPK